MSGKQQEQQQEPPENDDEAMVSLSEQMAADMQMAFDLANMPDDADEALRNAVDEHAASAPAELLDAGLVGGRVLGKVQRRSESSASTSTTAKKSSKKSFGSLFGSAKPKHSLSAAMEDGAESMDENSSLLYVACEIKGSVVEMMVDSGSQTSVMSSAMMTTLGLEKRLNEKYIGVCAGIGETRIIGRIENCPVRMGHVEFRLYFLVLDSPHNMMIFGIDQMRRFKCLIDLENDVLIFGGRGGVEVPFLPPDPDMQANSRGKDCTIS